MKVSFGRGSWLQQERSSWEMSYPWPPFKQVYENEPGLHIHLSLQDASDVITTISAAVSEVGAVIGNALGAFAGVIPLIVSHFIKNGDGSIDVHIAPHGFQVGSVPAADPNAWVNGAWAPVAAALWHMPSLEVVDKEEIGKKLEVPPPHLSSRGRLIEMVSF